MYTIKYEPQFKKDYKKFKKEHPELIKDFKNTVIQLTQKGKVGKDYDLHPLDKRGGNFKLKRNFYILLISDSVVKISLSLYFTASAIVSFSIVLMYFSM